MGRPRADLKGQVFGKLLVVDASNVTDNSGNVYWNCICDCGQTSVVGGYQLKRGSIKSCGCMQGGNDHGLAKHPLYQTWKKMIHRCYVPSDTGYYNYGALGIRVSEDWMKLENFIRDVGERPEGMTLDRIKSHLGYSKDNCRWASALEQRHNRRPVPVVNNSADSGPKSAESACNTPPLG